MTADRFWSKVDAADGPDACWPWVAARDRQGYGRFGPGKLAHRVAVDAPAGTVVRHSCDNPPCCNPRHLTIGTQAENIADAIARGTHTRLVGSAHGKAKLTEADVLTIRTRAAAGETGASLAGSFGVTAQTISQIIRGLAWVHVGGPTQPTRNAS